MKNEALRYCRYHLENLFVRASLAEPGTRASIIRDWHQVKVNRDYISKLQFPERRKPVHFLDLAA